MIHNYAPIRFSCNQIVLHKCNPCIYKHHKKEYGNLNVSIRDIL